MPMEIPGYYYDADKNRYFKIMKNSSAPPSTSSSSNNNGSSRTRSAEDLDRPTFVTKSFVAKKMRHELIQAATASPIAPPATIHPENGKKSGRNRKRKHNGQNPAPQHTHSANLKSRPGSLLLKPEPLETNKKSIFSILRSREIGVLNPRFCRDLVWEAEAAKLQSESENSIKNSGRVLDLSPWIHDRFVHLSKPQLALASDSSVVLLSIKTPNVSDEDENESSKIIKVNSSLYSRESSKVTNIQFAEGESEYDIFV
ncbi:UNVERIFIED_CONTAM: hypothetical protein HDU68_009505 [Siphonaria sp. JEL0065]|nr:hypothetical protein HDU68_009505 [Siphonaria sp. JEL0065]